MSRPGPTEWHVTPPMRALDFTWRARTNDSGLGQRIERLFGACRTGSAPRHEYVLDRRAAPGTAPASTLYLDDQPLLHDASDALVVAHLAWDLNERARASNDRALLLHAAAAELAGDVVVLPGASGAGKSTLVAAVGNGFRYLSDEIAAIDLTTLVVAPYPKPLSLDERSFELLRALRSVAHSHPAPGEHLVAPEEIPGAAIAPAGGRPKLLLFLSRNSRSYRREISRAQAVVALAPHTSNFEALGREALASVATFVRACRCYELHVGAPDDAAALVRRLLVAPQDETWSAPFAPTGNWRRDPEVDWVVVDGEAVLHDHARQTLHILNATAAEVWSSLDGRPLDDVVESFAGRYPDVASEVENDVRSTVALLVDLGVVVRV